jgi:TonB-linked SusC/RagA family outer membrane protein
MKELFTKLACGLALLLLAPGVAHAQQEGTVTGTVTDGDTGDPLPGASVQIRAINVGAATDTEGNFEFSAPAGEHTVSVSFVGYDEATKTIQVEANETTTVNFTLQPSSAELDEVVVTGYQTQTQEQETGSVSTVGAEELEGVTQQSADQALQGRAAGVRVTNATGQPGGQTQFRIRGSASISSGNQPLYIVDGVQINASDNASLSSSNPLAAIPPSDIESIRILKDASAASIYGAQAANGVVIITTKSGREGDTEVSFNAQLGSVEKIDDYSLMNTSQFLDYRAEAVKNTLGVSRSQGEALARQLYGNSGGISDSLNTGWADQIFQVGLSQNYNVSVRGGDEDTKYYVSARFQQQEGQIIDSQFRQGGLRTNFEQDVTDDIAVEAKVNINSNRYKGTISNGAFINSPFWAAQFIQPNIPLYNEPNNPDSGFNLQPGVVFSYNPVAQEQFNTRESLITNVISNVGVNYQFTDALTGRTFGGVSYEDTQENALDDPRIPSQAPGNATRFTDRTISYNVSQTFSYNNLFADVHSVSGLVGGELKQEDLTDVTANAQNLPSFEFRELSAAANPQTAFSSESGFRQLSVFGNAEYTYDDTYRISGTLRYDGNSRFGEENRWGLFGTVSGLWRLSNESFLEADWVNNLALRASYGVTGNSDIGNFQSRALLGAGPSYNQAPGIAPTGLGNTALTWEENWETNVGLDYSLFDGRLSGALDVYRRDRESQLLNRDIPFDTGFTQFTDNVGTVRSEGVEFSITTVNVRAGDFQWETNFNISTQRTEVLEVLPEDDEVIVGGLTFRQGEPFGQLEYVRYAGVNPANGRPLYLDANGELVYDFTSQDEKLVGNEQPDAFGGFGNTFSYKGLSVNVFFQYDYGRTTLDNNAFFSDIGYWENNKREDMTNYWQEPGDMAPEPRPYGGQVFLGETAWPDGSPQGVFTTRFVEDASYIRLKQVKVTYRLPQSLLQQTGLRNASLFVTGTNLLTFTEYSGIDPELVGTALGDYPQARTFQGGIRVGI